MEIGKRRIWQVAAGDGSERAYPDLLLKWDIVAIGPGEYGRWPESRERCRAERGDAQVRISERFASEMNIGDIVVLRLGKNAVYGVGTVESDYLWLDDLGDVDGWDLQHCRRVRWLWCYDNEHGIKKFPESTLRWGDSVQQATTPALTRWIEEIQVGKKAMTRPLVPLPDTCVDGQRLKLVTPEEISEYLFDQGIAADNIDALTSRMSDLVRIASWYARTGSKPAERETVAYLIVPLLRSLGWTPQRMAIEWNRIDIALFSALPRCEENLIAAVEAKKRGRTCLTSSTQVFGYASQPGRGKCLRAISTEGLLYGVFRRNATSTFKETPESYLNLTRMVSDYPLLGCAGAKEALLMMASDWSSTLDGCEPVSLAEDSPK